MPKLVLAYSGGLDTSIILHWLIAEGYEVYAYIADLGQDIHNEGIFQAATERAVGIGAKGAVAENLQEEFLRKFIFEALKADARYQDRYFMGTAIARPLIAKGQVEYAKRLGATVLSHGATGKGNDQVRFELAYRYLYPEAEIDAPWKNPKFLEQFQGRDDLIEYARTWEIPVKQTHDKPYSSDENMAHISYEAGMLEDPMQKPPEDMFQLTVSPQEAPDETTALEIDFERGVPIRVYNRNTGEELTNALDLFMYLNKVVGDNGVGRVDMVEDRYVGMKSRGVYEAPAVTVLHTVHVDLESITLDREVRKMQRHLSGLFADAAYNGYWFSPEMRAYMAVVDHIQQDVTGQVVVELYKGNATIIGRSSPLSLYNPEIASMHEAGKYDPTMARGFIDLHAIPLVADARREQKKSQY